MKYKPMILVVLFVLISGFLVYVTHAVSSQEFSIKVTFIDVNQGDSALIQNSDGYSILIDGGKVAAGPTVLAYLRNNGVYVLDAIVASHADSDHIGGLISVLDATDITVNSVIYNGYPGDTQTWSDFVVAVANEGLSLTTAQFPGELHWGTTTAYILNPPSGLVNPETNDASLVLLLDHYDIDTLFTGDIDSTVESEIIARGTPIAADILKVPHHGSNYSSSEEFLYAVRPLDSIISVGLNSYGHPGADTLGRLQAIGSKIWRTDRNGTIVVTSPNGISYEVIYSIVGEYMFFPFINKGESQSPTPNPPTPTPIIPTPPITNHIVITTVYYDGAGRQEPDEYVEIRNDDSYQIQLGGWTLRDIADHVYTFPNLLIQPGQVCRVYTNEDHPEWCGFNHMSGSAIWNNTGDCAYLRDNQSNLVDDYCY
jgi:competence protein ComEC